MRSAAGAALQKTGENVHRSFPQSPARRCGSFSLALARLPLFLASSQIAEASGEGAFASLSPPAEIPKIEPGLEMAAND